MEWGVAAVSVVLGLFVGYLLGRRAGHEAGHHVGRAVGREEGRIEADAARPRLEIRSAQFTRIKSRFPFRRRAEVIRHELWVNGVPTSLQSERELSSEVGVDEQAIVLLREVARVLEALPTKLRLEVDLTVGGPEPGKQPEVIEADQRRSR